MNISASQVKSLREKTGAGMMDCKTALIESNGDMTAAEDWLRKKGIARADKKLGRAAAEGLVGVAREGNKGVMVEINSETDFVARNEDFQKIVRDISNVALSTEGSVDVIANATYPNSSENVTEALRSAVAVIGENMILRRATQLTVENGVVATYVHNATSENMGKIGVLVAVETAGDPEAALVFGRQVAMHVAAINPLAVTADEIDAEIVARERAIYLDQARQSGKADNIAEKMVEGRMNKFFAEVVLLSQPFVINSDLTVGQAVEELSKKINAPVKITAFKRFVVGDGVEKEVTNFAEDVASMVKK
ncbi:translation elongation factor Ts [Bartonella sp. DGB1]|uniref:translation elongation factor Ts n=1 Tax=Bartonella sp. DGB1 TaxID=3239807 RepID=UPI0035256E22